MKAAVSLLLSQLVLADSYFDHNGNLNLKFDRNGKFKIM